jgi:hypothetical protein
MPLDIMKWTAFVKPIALLVKNLGTLPKDWSDKYSIVLWLSGNLDPKAELIVAAVAVIEGKTGLLCSAPADVAAELDLDFDGTTLVAELAHDFERSLMAIGHVPGLSLSPTLNPLLLIQIIQAIYPIVMAIVEYWRNRSEKPVPPPGPGPDVV